jgi:hypothetical protein
MKHLVAFILFAILMTVSCLEGGVSERARQSREQDTLISACRENNRILENRYQYLASESDWLTLVSAEARYQGGVDGR